MLLMEPLQGSQLIFNAFTSIDGIPPGFKLVQNGIDIYDETAERLY
jgi:hypothetical protein